VICLRLGVADSRLLASCHYAIRLQVVEDCQVVSFQFLADQQFGNMLAASVYPDRRLLAI